MWAVTLAEITDSWNDPHPMSPLHALLFFGGITLAIIVGITLLVMAPSLAKGPRYRPSQQWEAESEWFGAPTAEGTDLQRRAITPGQTARDRPTDEVGGASASW